MLYAVLFFFFFQAEDGIRDYKVTGVQTCALPICVKHLDWDTNTLMSASGDSRLYASHHLFSGSVTASVPMRLSQVGISGGGLSAAHAATVAHSADTASSAGTAHLRLLWATLISPREPLLFEAAGPG